MRELATTGWLPPGPVPIPCRQSGGTRMGRVTVSPLRRGKLSVRGAVPCAGLAAAPPPPRK
jgi:hypothetical protein